MKKIFLIIPFLFLNIYPQFNGNEFSIGVNGIYTTTAKIYLTPNSTDPVLRNASFPIEDIFSYSVDFRYRFYDAVVAGLNVGYMQATDIGPNITVFDNTGTKKINVEDGFLLIPVELSSYYILPFSTENFKFAMGAGGGFYFGKQIRKFGDTEISTVDRENAYGIHVSVSMDYMIQPYLSIRSAMKFRDPQFIVTSKYKDRKINYNNDVITLAQDTFTSKINVDGISFILGFVFHF